MPKPRPIHAPVTADTPHAPIRTGESRGAWFGDAAPRRAHVRAGRDPGRPWKGDHALIGYASRGNAVAVKLLLGAGADPNAAAGAGNTPLESTRHPRRAKIHELLQAATARTQKPPS